MASYAQSSSYKNSLDELWDKLLHALQEDPYIAKEDIYAQSLDTAADYIHCQFTTRANLGEFLTAYGIDMKNKSFLETIARLAHMNTSIEAHKQIEKNLIKNDTEADQDIRARHIRAISSGLAKTNTLNMNHLKLLWYTVFANVIWAMLRNITSAQFTSAFNGFFVYKCFKTYTIICPRPWHMGIDELHALDATVFTLDHTKFAKNDGKLDCEKVNQLQNRIMQSVAPGMPARLSVCNALLRRQSGSPDAVIAFEPELNKVLDPKTVMKNSIEGRKTFFIQ